jgi:Tol biopolymer transport system component
MHGINAFLWLPDGRVVYSMPEPGAISSTFNFWIMRLDEQGKPIEKPRRLTNLTGFGMVPTSVTEDGKHLAFLQWAYHTTVYVADLQSDGSRIGNARHFTLTESQDIAADWTADSKGIILLSNRNGHTGIYKQSPDTDSPQLFGGRAVRTLQPSREPDGNWILRFGRGTGQKHLSSRESPSRRSVGTRFSSENRKCSPLLRAPSEPVCVIAEPSGDSRRFTLTAFDPAIGRGLELIGLNLQPGVDSPETDLSPDGKRFAVVTSPDGPISLFSSHGQPMGTIRPVGLSRIQFIHWAARGRGIYVTTGEEGGRVLWYVDLQGGVQQIWKNRGGNWALGIPSPDGRYLAIESSDESQNVWLMENF